MTFLRVAMYARMSLRLLQARVIDPSRLLGRGSKPGRVQPRNGGWADTAAAIWRGGSFGVRGCC